MEYKLYRGNCLDIMKNIGDKSIDMILCDPPYGVTARNKWDAVIPFEALWKEYKRIIKDNGAIVLFGQGMFTANLMTSNPKMWRYNLIWKKTQPVGFLNANRMPLRSHEDICIFYKKLPVYNPQKTDGRRKISLKEHKKNCKTTPIYSNYKPISYDSAERFPTSVLTFSKDTQKSALHSTQKPVALLEWLIKTYTNENETVLDNCMGSGSTGVACINTNRNFIGIEIEEEMFQTTKERINNCYLERKK